MGLMKLKIQQITYHVKGDSEIELSGVHIEVQGDPWELIKTMLLSHGLESNL